MSTNDSYNGDRDRRKSSQDDSHFNITQQNVRDIGEMRSDIAGLKVGQDALGAQTSAGFSATSEKFDHLSRQLTELAKPKPPVAIIPLFTLAMVVLGGFGTVMVFLSNQTATSMQREADMQLEHITERFQIAEQNDDDRHQIAARGRNLQELEDAYRKGVAIASFEDLRAQFQTLETQLTEQHRVDIDWRLQITDRIAKTESKITGN